MNKAYVTMVKPVYLVLLIIDINVWVLVRLCKTEVWRQCKAVLHIYRQLHGTHKIRL